MIITGVRDLCSTKNKPYPMKKIVFVLLIISGISILNFSCKNSTVKESSKSSADSSEFNSDLIVVGKDIITEVILNPDSLSDPWEAEKVKNFNGKLFYARLFENIYNQKVTVYEIFTGKALSPNEVRKIEKEYKGDFSKIGKLQFHEDWYFNTVSNKIVKRIKSVTFAYTIQREPGLPPGYKGLFDLKIEQ
jgi:hypothetical protein